MPAHHVASEEQPSLFSESELGLTKEQLEDRARLGANTVPNVEASSASHTDDHSRSAPISERTLKRMLNTPRLPHAND